MFEDKSPRWLYWGLLITFVVANGYFLYPVFCYLRSTLILIVTAALLAFLLNYPVKIFMSWNLKRGYAVALVFLIASIILSTATLTLLPLLLQQLNEFARRLPSWIDSGSLQLKTFETWAIDKNLPFDVSTLLIQLQERFATEVKTLPTYIINFLISVFDSSLELLVTVVLTFYLLLHGESFLMQSLMGETPKTALHRFWQGIWDKFPDRWENRLKLSFKQSFQNYFIGHAAIAS